MPLRVMWRLLLFLAYVGLFCVIPFAILYAEAGIAVGVIVAALVVLALGYQAPERIARRLGVVELSSAEYPFLHSLTAEYCRRLHLPPPKLAILNHPQLNMACFGFSRTSSYLVVTRGLMETMKREQISALIGRQICSLWMGDVFCETWLSQFLSFFDRWVALPRARSTSAQRKVYPFRIFLRQLVLYPLTLIPILLLKRSRPSSIVDLMSIKMTRQPQALSEGLRLLQAKSERNPSVVPMSLRHLFLIAPPAEDPVARVFFARDEILDRIGQVERKLLTAQAV